MIRDGRIAEGGVKQSWIATVSFAPLVGIPGIAVESVGQTQSPQERA